MLILLSHLLLDLPSGLFHAGCRNKTHNRSNYKPQHTSGYSMCHHNVDYLLACAAISATGNCMNGESAGSPTKNVSNINGSSLTKFPKQMEGACHHQN